ncbi:MAG: NAD(+)/NADH kinase [Candidatus Dormibacteria bacterium]
MSVAEPRGVIAFLLNLQEDPLTAELRESTRLAEAAGFRTVVAQREPEAVIGPNLSGLRLLVTIGGDGTLLYGARLVAPSGIPVLGVNRGHLGFLASVELPDLPQAIAAFAEGRCRREGRSTLRAVINEDRAPLPSSRVEVAVNEVVLKAEAFNLVRIRVRADSDLIGDFDADGLIVATSIGSTAYSLSAGGPPVDPAVPALVVTPLNPHAILGRSLVIPDSCEVTVEMRRGRAVVGADGLAWGELVEGGELRVSRGPRLDFCEPPGTSGFFSKLRSKTGFATVLKLPLEPGDQKQAQRPVSDNPRT